MLWMLDRSSSSMCHMSFLPLALTRYCILWRIDCQDQSKNGLGVILLRPPWQQWLRHENFRILYKATIGFLNGLTFNNGSGCTCRRKDQLSYHVYPELLNMIKHDLCWKHVKSPSSSYFLDIKQVLRASARVANKPVRQLSVPVLCLLIQQLTSSFDSVLTLY